MEGRKKKRKWGAARRLAAPWLSRRARPLPTRGKRGRSEGRKKKRKWGTARRLAGIGDRDALGRSLIREMGGGRRGGTGAGQAAPARAARAPGGQPPSRSPLPRAQRHSPRLPSPLSLYCLSPAGFGDRDALGRSLLAGSEEGWKGGRRGNGARLGGSPGSGDRDALGRSLIREMGGGRRGGMGGGRQGPGRRAQRGHPAASRHPATHYPVAQRHSPRLSSPLSLLCRHLAIARPSSSLPPFLASCE